jgi:hypothetical protein
VAKRYDISSPRQRGDKTYWVRIGSAFEDEKGISLVFDALPLPDKDGRCSARLFEPRERDQGGGAPRTQNPAREPVGYDDSDDVPFVTANPALEARVS